MLGDRVREAMLRGNSGRLYQQMGDMDKAEVITRQAVDMLESSPPGYPKANVMGQLATLLQGKGKGGRIAARSAESAGTLPSTRYVE
ncbi:MAG: hypothetical protein IPI72_07365 [Flavobacteriales bacterium]|nr:hypothetical protein [Flavobacteriales bacterium]